MSNITCNWNQFEKENAIKVTPKQWSNISCVLNVLYTVVVDDDGDAWKIIRRTVMMMILMMIIITITTTIIIITMIIISERKVSNFSYLWITWQRSQLAFRFKLGKLSVVCQENCQANGRLNEDDTEKNHLAESRKCEHYKDWKKI